jgi:hypothetical protein
LDGTLNVSVPTTDPQLHDGQIHKPGASAYEQLCAGFCTFATVGALWWADLDHS